MSVLLWVFRCMMSYIPVHEKHTVCNPPDTVINEQTNNTDKTRTLNILHVWRFQSDIYLKKSSLTLTSSGILKLLLLNGRFKPLE